MAWEVEGSRPGPVTGEEGEAVGKGPHKAPDEDGEVGSEVTGNFSFSRI